MRIGLDILMHRDNVSGQTGLVVCRRLILSLRGLREMPSFGGFATLVPTFFLGVRGWALVQVALARFVRR
jgi:hypothetical protein